jgi:CRP/FNR family transcriptional regulator
MYQWLPTWERWKVKHTQLDPSVTQVTEAATFLMHFPTALEGYISNEMSILKHTRSFFPFMANLAEASQRRLNESARILHEKKGRELLARGDFVGGAYLVMTGELDVYIIDREGREASMYRVRASESCLFAINALFGNVPYPAWVRVTSSAATILMIPAAVLKELHHQEKSIRDWVFGVQSQRIFDLVSTLEAVQTLPVEARLRSYLLRAANGEHEVKVTHEAIARYLGTAREVITRNLRTFASAGLVALTRGCVKILDAKRLGIPDLPNKIRPESRSHF